MGLTIHYEFHAPCISTFAAARQAIANLHARASELHFDQCSNLIEWNDRTGDPHVARCHSYFMSRDETNEKEKSIFLLPSELVMFVVRQPGSETAAFGMGRYPLRDSGQSSGLQGFHWRTFCKTQYASLSNNGGWENFFKTHDGICRILDEAKKQNLSVEVTDEGGYWEKRDKVALRAQIDRCNALIAAFTGKLKDAMKDRADGALVAPIKEDPSFEHMEAQGQLLLNHPPDIHVIDNPDNE